MTTRSAQPSTDRFAPAGDQPAALNDITRRLTAGDPVVVLAGATGTGKSATTAWTIEQTGKPALVLAPNKVLAAQLAAELRELLPSRFVGFFVSHFSYYRPEAYLPTSDTFIEKDSAVDQEIERLRHEATVGLLTKPGSVIVASISAIYGLGRPDEYRARGLPLAPGSIQRDTLIRKLVAMGYARNDAFLDRGRFRVRGDTIDLQPATDETVLRLEFFGDDLETVRRLDQPATRQPAGGPEWIFPTSHHVIPETRMRQALAGIRSEMETRCEHFTKNGLLIEAQRLRLRTEADLETLETTGSCRGVENYSRHFDNRTAGDPPACLVDYFPPGFLLVVDESHVTVPQIAAMHEGDQARKRVLVEHGFRLPSALDNRPLSGPEFWQRINQTLALTATPGAWERQASPTGFVQQVIRPTGLVDPGVSIAPQEGRLVDLLGRIRDHLSRGNRTLVTTLTKKQAETLTDYLQTQALNVAYLHSGVGTVDRISTLRDLRTGKLDVIVGVNLLREGLDLPEVGLVAILDADSQGFLRSATSLIQTIGRAARNPAGHVVMYADRTTPAMAEAIRETDRRRAIQQAHNTTHGITPRRLAKHVTDVVSGNQPASEETPAGGRRAGRTAGRAGTLERLLAELRAEHAQARSEMAAASAQLRFEEAASWRDEAAVLASEIAELSPDGHLDA